MVLGTSLINISIMRTISTRESFKGTSISTSQTLIEPLPNEVLLKFPDPKLTIGARIPIPFRTEPSLPYAGENIFGRRKKRLRTMSPPSICKEGTYFCYYCNVEVTHMKKHASTVKCRKAREEFLILPQLTNLRAFRRVVISPRDSEEDVPPQNFPPQAIEWVENFDLMSQLARMGLGVDFGASDFLLSAATIPTELRDYCALQTRSGTFLEAVLLSVSKSFLLSF